MYIIGERQKTIKRITKMITKGCSKEELLNIHYTEEEYEEAEKELIAIEVIRCIHF